VNGPKAAGFVQVERVRVCAGYRKRDRIESQPLEFSQGAFDHSAADASTLMSRVNRDLADVSDASRNPRRYQDPSHRSRAMKRHSRRLRHEITDGARKICGARIWGQACKLQFISLIP
jgi:hypothetical protein